MTTNPKDALGVKKAPLRFVPPALAILASDAMADGAAKYGPFNWRETAVRMTVYLEAIERHLAALKDGQDRAEDSGHLHLSHITACCAIIADAAGIGKLIDDRPVAGPAADMLRERDKTFAAGTGAAAPNDAPLDLLPVLSHRDGHVERTLLPRGARVRILHSGRTLRAGMIGQVIGANLGYMIVDVPGVRSKHSPDGAWRLLVREVEVIK